MRLDGQDDEAGKVAELLAQLLPELSQGRCKVGEISPAYPNRRRAGARRYLDLYLLDEPDGAAVRRTGRAVATRRGEEVGR